MRRMESLMGSDNEFGSGDRIGHKPGEYTVEIGWNEAAGYFPVASNLMEI